MSSKVGIYHSGFEYSRPLQGLGFRYYRVAKSGDSIPFVKSG